MQLLGDRILVEIKGKEKIGSLYIPVSSQHNNSRAAVVINPGSFEWVKKGNNVVINGFTARGIEIENNTDCYLVAKDDILCKVEKIGK